MRRSIHVVLSLAAIVAVGCSSGGSSSSSSNGASGTPGTTTGGSGSHGATSSGTSSSTTSSTGGSTTSSTGSSTGGSTTGSSSATTTGGSSGSTGTTGVTPVYLLVTPPSATVALGVTQPFQAIEIFSDGHTADVTGTASWDTSDHGIATVDASGTATPVAAGGPITVTATLPGSTLAGSAQLTVSAATLVRIEVTASSVFLALGTTQAFHAIGHYSDGNTSDVTTQASWASSDTSIATVDDTTSKGLVTAQAPGTATLTATVGRVTGSASVTVGSATLQSIAVAGSVSSTPKGSIVQFTATGTYSDSSTHDLTSSVTWSSDSADVVVSNLPGHQGQALAVNVTSSPANITATDPVSALQGSAQLTVTAATLVSLAVTPAQASVPLGLAQTFVATGTYSDTTTANLSATVTWSTTPGSYADGGGATAFVESSSAQGAVIRSLAQGSTVVTATDPATSLSATANLDVTVPVLTSLKFVPDYPQNQADVEFDYDDAGAQSLAMLTGGYFEGYIYGGYSDGTWYEITSQVTTTPIDPNHLVSDDAGNSYVSNGAYNGYYDVYSLTGEGHQYFDFGPARPLDGSEVDLSTDPLTLTWHLTAPGYSTDIPVTVYPHQISSISVTPAILTFTLDGGAQQFTATADYNDGLFNGTDLTDVLAWSVTDAGAGVYEISNDADAGSAGVLVATTPPLDATTLVTASAGVEPVLGLMTGNAFVGACPYAGMAPYQGTCFWYTDFSGLRGWPFTNWCGQTDRETYSGYLHHSGASYAAGFAWTDTAPVQPVILRLAIDMGGYNSMSQGDLGLTFNGVQVAGPGEIQIVNPVDGGVAQNSCDPTRQDMIEFDLTPFLNYPDGGAALPDGGGVNYIVGGENRVDITIGDDTTWLGTDAFPGTPFYLVATPTYAP